jgi:hypothetical protein
MVGRAIGDKTYMGSGGRRLPQVPNDSTDDGFTQAAPLVFGFNRDIDYLVEQAAVANHSAHPDYFVVFQDDNTEKRIR